MNRYNVNVLAEAKKEYTAQLVNTITPEVYVGIKSMYTAASEYCKRTNEKNVLIKFQTLLSKTPGWNQEKINNEFERIQKSTNVDYLTDLLTAIFVSHTKVLASIKMKKKTQSFELDVPNGPHFIHKVYIECARKFWRYPYLLHTEFSNLELQRNLLQSETFIKECVEETIRKLLPVRYVLKECLGDDYNDDEDSEEDIRSTISKSTRNNIRKLIKLEIEQTLSRHSQADDKFSKLEIKDDSSPINEQIEQMIADSDQSIKETIEESTKEVLAEQTESNNESKEEISVENASTSPEESTVLEKDDSKIEPVVLESKTDDNTALELTSNMLEKLVQDTDKTSVEKEDSDKENDENKQVNTIVDSPVNETKAEVSKEQTQNPTEVKEIVLEKNEQSTELTEETDNNEDDENTAVTDETLEDENTAVTDETVEDNLEEGPLKLLEDNKVQENDIKNIDLVITNKTNDKKEAVKPETEVKPLLNEKTPVQESSETKVNNDVISLSKLQSLEDIRNEINKDIVENSLDNEKDDDNDEFSFFDDAANF